jgi:hypothetical protein
MIPLSAASPKHLQERTTLPSKAIAVRDYPYGRG